MGLDAKGFPDSGPSAWPGTGTCGVHAFQITNCPPPSHPATFQKLLSFQTFPSNASSCSCSHCGRNLLNKVPPQA